MLMVDHNKLKTFLVVAEKQSISKAAHALGRTQSAISQQLLALEKELELVLFERRSGRIFLTKEGHSILNGIRSEFRKIEEVIQVNRNKPQSIEGVIFIGISSNYCKYYLVPLVNQFCVLFPKARFEIRELRDEDIEQKLLTNELDFGFMVSFKNKNLFETYPAFRFKEYFVGSSQYLRKFSKTLSIKDVSRFSLIDFSEGLQCIRSWLIENRRLRSANVAGIQTRFVVSTHETVKQLILAHHGVGMIPEFMIREELRQGTLLSVFPKAKGTQLALEVAIRAKRNFNCIHNEFLKFVISEAKVRASYS